jgi:ABC-2 type transport system permease protein
MNNKILLVTSHQLQDVLREPLVILIALILIGLSIINGAASAKQVHLADLQLTDPSDHFFSIGISNALYHTSILLSALSMFIGALTIAEEKADGSLRVLNTKPVYRRDVYVGKFAGLSAFLLLLTIVITMLCASTLMIFYRSPYSTEEFIIRMATFTVVIFLSCVLTLGISMLIGIWLNNLLSILIYIGTFLCLDWFFTLPRTFEMLRLLIPTSLYYTIIEGGGGRTILNTANAFPLWLDGALPFIMFMIIEIAVVFVVSSNIISRSEL